MDDSLLPSQHCSFNSRFLYSSLFPLSCFFFASYHLPGRLVGTKELNLSTVLLPLPLRPQVSRSHFLKVPLDARVFYKIRFLLSLPLNILFTLPDSVKARKWCVHVCTRTISHEILRALRSCNLVHDFYPYIDIFV